MRTLGTELYESAVNELKLAKICNLLQTAELILSGTGCINLFKNCIPC